MKVARRAFFAFQIKIEEDYNMKKTTVKSKGKKIRAKIIFIVCLVLFAAALIAALIAIDRANDKSGSTPGGIAGTNLPLVDLSDMISGN